MHLLLVVGIGVAIVAVAFALQNNTEVSVDLAFWSFESSLAMVLLLALGIGAIIAILLSWPRMIRSQWVNSRLRRQISRLETDKAGLEQRILQLEEQLKRVSPEPVPEEPSRYVALRSLLLGNKDENTWEHKD